MLDGEEGDDIDNDDYVVVVSSVVLGVFVCLNNENEDVDDVKMITLKR